MTFYPLNYFDCTSGILEQIALICMVLKVTNRQFINDAIKKDFVANSIDWGVTEDLTLGDRQAKLQLKATFEINSYFRNQLKRYSSIDRRISSFVATNVDKLGLYREQAYERRSFTVKNLPEYLRSEGTENILERRLCYLMLHTISIQSWINEWNELAYFWQLRKYRPIIINLKDNIPELADIEARRDELLSQLQNGIPFRVYTKTGAVPSGLTAVDGEDFGTAESTANFYSKNSDPSGDPSYDRGYMSSGLLNRLNSQGIDNQFGSNSSEPTANTPKEQPTLPDC
jgi:hypothetical protein